MTAPARRQRKTEALAALHRGEPFVIPNPWDVGSARVLEALADAAAAIRDGGDLSSLATRVPLSEWLAPR